MQLVNFKNKIIKNPRLYSRMMLAHILAKFGTPDFVGTNVVRSDSDDGSYIRSVKSATQNTSAFANFKRSPHYIRILEHVTEAQGLEYLDILSEQSPDLLKLIDLFKDNDIVGNPYVYKYGEFGYISPTTLRYAKVASDLQVHFGNLSGFRIAEIGAGYGGQALILDRIWKLNSHTIFDLDPVLGLISRYLECHLLNGSYNVTTLNRVNESEKPYDLVISNYAFSELPKIVQIRYIEKVLGSAKRGYLTMNSGLPDSAHKGGLILSELKELLPSFKIIDERPSIANGNYVIVWDNA